MADTQVEAAIFSKLGERSGLWGPYWADVNNGVIIFIDGGGDISTSYTDDGGATWTTTEIDAGTTYQVAAFYDKEVPGDSGTLIHLVWLDQATNDCYYRTVDASDGTFGTQRTVDSTITVEPAERRNRCSITKTVGGNLLVGFMTLTEYQCYRSVDAGVNWVDRADIYEGNAAGNADWCLMFPAITADDNDACALFGGITDGEVVIKMYDDSANSWTETAVVTTSNISNAWIPMGGAVRHSDGHILAAIHTLLDDATDDLVTYDITPDSISSPTVTAKTNIFTNQGESGGSGVLINQQNDDVYVGYLKGGTWASTVDAVFHKSADGMGSWGSEQAYSEAAADDLRAIHGGRSITNVGGRVQWVFYNDDTTDIWVNLVNDIEITSAGITGTSAVTNTNDSQAASGILENAGTSTTTSINDSQSASGILDNSGSAATTNANDTQAAAGELSSIGTSTTTNSADTQAASGILDNSGSAATTNANDAHAADGLLDNGGSAATTNSNDAQAAAGVIGIIGSSATTNAADIQSAAGQLTNDGSAATTNINDSQASSGILENIGASITTNANDAQEASGTVTAVGITGTSVTINNPDAQSSVGILAIIGTSITTAANDAQFASGFVGVIVGDGIEYSLPGNKMNYTLPGGDKMEHSLPGSKLNYTVGKVDAM